MLKKIEILDFKYTILIALFIGITYCVRAQRGGHTTVKKDTLAQKHADTIVTNHDMHDM